MAAKDGQAVDAILVHRSGHSAEGKQRSALGAWAVARLGQPWQGVVAAPKDSSVPRPHEQVIGVGQAIAHLPPERAGSRAVAEPPLNKAQPASLMILFCDL